MAATSAADVKVAAWRKRRKANTLSGVADGSKYAAAESSGLSRSAASLTRLEVMPMAAENAAVESSSPARSADSEHAEW